MLFIVVATSVFSQTAISPVNPFELLEKLVHDKVNQLRDSCDLSRLEPDPILGKAAAFQAKYCRKIDDLDHYQTKKRFYFLWDRVQHFNGIHPDVGENLLFHTALTDLSYETLAEGMFQSWKNSPGHFANMIGDRYHRSGLKFNYAPETGKVYAAQVFGGIPWDPPSNVKNHRRAWRLKKYDERYCSEVKRINLLSKKYDHHISISHDSIFIQFKDIRSVYNLIPRKKDGFSIDIFQRSQFPCDSPNRLHGSPIHNGILLRPQFSKKMYRKNILRKEGKFWHTWENSHKD